ncbi:MAG: hypothetical protein P857_82 [Candidatus Xenolissoclinum pacificiensis L6]|uniref:Uncharacterized protein n=1 Tax=Candidatus Xenolissoclinum pacificiensis L6 TaxID=1401685 RepID=W2UZC6_9RICK|nr:MAG: hypothetical protein P857_82 [Candidatus Xenolissoclinum pacificiensis L6]
MLDVNKGIDNLLYHRVIGDLDASFMDKLIVLFHTKSTTEDKIQGNQDKYFIELAFSNKYLGKVLS